MTPLPAPAAESAAESVLRALRQGIIAGERRPGDRLVDATVAEQYGVSRNTARDALRLLAAEGLAASVRNAGYSVRTLSVADVRDLYAARRIIESGAVLQSHAAPEELLEAVEAAVSATERSVHGGDWASVGTGSLSFHQAIVRLAGSPSLDRAFNTIAAQLRLAFAVMPDESAFQVQWIARDREIVELLLSGAREEAAAELASYLDASEARVIDAVRGSERARSAHEPAAIPDPSDSPIGAETGPDPSPDAAAAPRGAAAPKGRHD